MRTLEGWGLKVQVVAEMKFDIPQTYKFHSQKNVNVEVDLIRVGLPQAANEGTSCDKEGPDEVKNAKAFSDSQGYESP